MIGAVAGGYFYKALLGDYLPSENSSMPHRPTIGFVEREESRSQTIPIQSNIPSRIHSFHGLTMPKHHLVERKLTWGVSPIKITVDEDRPNDRENSSVSSSTESMK